MTDTEDVSQQLEVLQKDKENLEREFGLKRAKFMELFKQKEDEVKKLEINLESVQSENLSFQSELQKIKTELDDVKTATAIAESSREDEMVTMRRHYEEEAASMQHLIKEAVAQAQQSITNKYQQEMHQVQMSNEKLASELQDAHNKLEREGFLDSIAKTLQKKVNTLGGSSNTEDENLEESMKKAQEDAEILKSVVLPLEQEITSLKEQLHIANQRLRDNAISSSKEEVAGNHNTVEDEGEKVKELSHNLETEKSSRSDLEMYVAVLSAQKNTIQTEAEKLKTELQDVMKLLALEKREHQDLRNTWHVNTDQFLESQRLMMMDMTNMETLLTEEQQRQLEELKRADAERQIQERKVQELEEKRQKSEEEARISVEVENSDSSNDKSKGSLTSLASEDFLKFDGDENVNLQRSQSNQSLSTTKDQTFTDSGVHDTKSLNEDTCVEGSEIHSAVLTDAQQKAIADAANEFKVSDSVLAAVKAKTEGFSLEGKKLVSHHEWSMMQKELRGYRDRIGKPCDMCKNYEAQLQQIQSKEKEAQAQVRTCERQLEEERSTVKSLQAYKEELEQSLKESNLEAQSKISDLNGEVAVVVDNIEVLKRLFEDARNDLQDEIRKMTAERQDIHKELIRLQEENDKLIGKHSKHSQQLQEETINLPENLEDMQLLLLTYREDVIAAKVAKEHMEESLRSEIMFVKSQMVAEQQEKNKMEEELSNDISHLQEELAILQSVKSELDRQTKLKNETETKLKEAEGSLKSIQAKSKQLIGALQSTVEEHSTARTKLEGQVYELKVKAQGLTQDLDNSEAVQRDFVKLSQSLQMQLEKIRAAEHEVRWQHDEDINDCTNCKKTFEVLRKKVSPKNHCRHCGKIFCADCVTKTVPSGPNSRPAKVCDVCHTILVRDATPYFSTELPQTPD